MRHPQRWKNRTNGLIGTRDLAALVCWSPSGLAGVRLRAEAFTHTSDMPVMCVDERQEDLRRQRKRIAASTNCVPVGTRPQKILSPSGHSGTKYPQCGKLALMGIVGSVDNSVSRDSDRFLAVGAVTQSDRLEIELVQRPDTPAAILIKWPPQPTVTDPAKLTATIAAIVRVLGMAQIELAARRASGKFKRRRQTQEVVLRRS
jgi:hypothetical protein